MSRVRGPLAEAWRTAQAGARDARASGPAVIEVAGLPGAGKSTLAAAWLDALAARGATIEVLPRLGAPGGRLARLREAAALIALRPAISAAALRAAGASPAGFGLTADLLRRVRSLEAAARAAPAPELLIFDEALVQSLWSLVQGRPQVASARARPLLPALVAPHRYALVELAASPALAATRLAARGGTRSRFDGLEPEVAAGALRNGPATFEALRRGAEFTSLVLEADAPIADNVARLLALTVQVAGRVNGLRVSTTARWTGPRGTPP